MVDGNVSEPAVVGSPSPAPSDDLTVQVMNNLVAEADSEEPAEAEAIGRVKREQPVQAGAGKESIEEPAEATAQPEAVTPEPTGEDEELTPEKAVAEVKRLREESKKLQAAKDKQLAQYQAQQYQAQLEREQLVAQQEAYKKQLAQWQAQQEAIAEQAREAQRQAEAAAFERELATQPPEVQTAYRVAMKYIADNQAKQEQIGHETAIRKMNSMLMQGVPGEAFQGLPDDRPLTPEMVDYAAARYMDWQYMQQTAARVKPLDMLKAIKEKRQAAPVAPPAPPQPPQPVAPPKPVAQRVTPGTGGRPSSNTAAQLDAAIAANDWGAVDKLRRQLGIEYKERSSE